MSRVFLVLSFPLALWGALLTGALRGAAAEYRVFLDAFAELWRQE